MKGFFGRFPSRARGFLGALTLPLLLMPAAAQEIGFIERFALAEDRAAVLKELTPGTEDYYTFHALHYQNINDRARFDEILTQWRKRSRNPSVGKWLENRQALIDFDKDPQATLAYLKEALGLSFDHQRERKQVDPTLATTLDPDLIALEAIVKRSLENARELGEMSAAGIDWLMRHWGEVELSVPQKRALLGRLQRPDYSALVEAVVEDLERRESKGFGEFPVHENMTLAQLEALGELRERLLGEETYVYTRLRKLQPHSEIDLSRNQAERQAYLERAWEFVSTLGTAFHSLQAHVLYQRLSLDASLGRYDRERFLTYLRLPRPVTYLNRTYRERLEIWRHPVDLNFDGAQATGLGPIQNDEHLVRRYLLHFLTGADSFEAFAPYVTEDYLKATQAEANIVSGYGDVEKWASQLSPAAYQALKERVDLDFDPSCQEHFKPGERVRLTMHVKNVRNLIVKIFEINTESYHRHFDRPINTDLNLDGLVANEELTFDYDDDPFRRHEREFAFPQLDASRGVWVLEFIGNGKSSRALIRRGDVHFVSETSAGGHVLRLFDETHEPLPSGFVWMGGRRFDPDDTGEILIPFSTEPGARKILLNDGQGFTRSGTLRLESERYQLKAGFYVDRESLLSGAEATVVVRPLFSLNGLPRAVELLDETTLTVTSENLDGVSSSTTVRDFELHPHKESTYRFRVPERLHALRFELSAEVKNLSTGETDRLQAEERFVVNEIDQTDAISDLFLAKAAEGYSVQLLGRSGEVLPDHAINLNLRRDDFRTDVHVTLKTDVDGRVHLGALEGIYRVTATAPNGRRYRWVLPRDERVYPSTVHARVGETIRIPVVDTAQEGRAAFSLLERTPLGAYVSDRLDAVTVVEGEARIAGLSPGTYHFTVKEAEHTVTIQVSAGKESEGYLFSDTRILESWKAPALRMEPLVVEGEELVIRLKEVNPNTRVHVLAGRFQPAFPSFDLLGRGIAVDPASGVPGVVRNDFVSGRAIGDEYRYIIERRYAEKYPGNMLTRPGLLLNPWAIRDTSTDREDLAVAQQWAETAPAPAAAMASRKRASAKAKEEEAGWRDPHALHFLGQPGVLAINADPGEDGVIRVKLEGLRDCQFVRVLAIDPRTAVERQLALPMKDRETRDVRLADGLHSKRHFTQQDQVSILEANKAFTLEKGSGAQFELYETFADVFQLLQTLNPGANLERFAFLLHWPALEASEKRAHYSEHASHELSFFLQRKDPAFFQEVILPYLSHKKDKTFMDHYLLGQDVSGYVDPWRYSQLNVVERILLGQRLPTQRETVERDVADWLGTLPPEEREELLDFEKALGGRALDRLGEPELAVREELRRSGMARGMEQADSLSLMDDGVSAFGVTAEKEHLAENEVRFMREQKRRGRARGLGFYRKLETTKEWAENNYYHLPIDEQNAALVPVNKYWYDFAKHEGNGPFVSGHVTEVTRNFTEMLLALAVLDLPFTKGDKDETLAVKDGQLTVTSKAPAILFHKEIRESALGQVGQILVSQNFYRKGEERQPRMGGGETVKFITEEFLTGVVYGCQIVVTNPTAAVERLQLLTQIPQGAIPVDGSRELANRSIRLEPYQTHTETYAFYFPKAGAFEHFPVHVSKEDKVVAFAEPITFQVVDELSEMDTQSWAYVSQWGSEEDVLAYLQKHNLRETDLTKIAWRCRESTAFFTRVIALLEKRHHYDDTLFSYALHHGETGPLRQYLLHADRFLAQCGSYLETTLVTIDPVERKNYQHLEYSPLVNARAYPVGGKHTILNDRFREQYGRLMTIYSQRPALDDAERLTLTVYLLLQDRVGEALEVIDRVDREALSTGLQYDYLQAYLAFYREDPSAARRIAERYAQYPVDRWRERFLEVLAQVDEIEGKIREGSEDDTREQRQNALAAKEPGLTFTIADGKIEVLYRNLQEITVNYYRMDLEFLFSTNPFVSSEAARFSMIKPNRTDRVALVAEREGMTIPLPEAFEGENVLVEITGGGIRQASAHYSNSLKLEVSPNYGQLRVAHADDPKRPLAKVYVKVYAEVDGKAQFYKDGYTDLRGKFDYASLSTDDLASASRFSILVMSEEHGALVQEAQPPQR